MKVDKRRKVTPETVKKMQELRGKGMTYQAISEKLSLSYLTVYKYLNKEEKAKGDVEIKKEEQVNEKKVGFFGRLKKNLGI